MLLSKALIKEQNSHNLKKHYEGVSLEGTLKQSVLTSSNNHEDDKTKRP